MGVGGQVQQAEGMGWSRRHEERVLAGPGREVGCRSLGYDASEAPHSQEEGGCTLRGEGREQGQVPGRRQTGSRKQRGLGGGARVGNPGEGLQGPNFTPGWTVWGHFCKCWFFRGRERPCLRHSEPTRAAGEVSGAQCRGKGFHPRGEEEERQGTRRN